MAALVETPQSALKILFYNWADYEVAPMKGGGITVYQRNLVQAALAHGDAVTFLSSGQAYSVRKSAVRIRPASSRQANVRKFEVVDSPLLTPGWPGPDELAAWPAFEAVFVDFLHTQGPFDVVHFNSLEGLPPSFLAAVKVASPSTKVVVSLHNYFPVCPQVNLFIESTGRCTDYEDGKRCVTCVPQKNLSPRAKLRGMVETKIASLGVSRIPGYLLVRKYLVRALRSLGANPQASPETTLTSPSVEALAKRRHAFLAAMETHADSVLAVSKRVESLYRSYGLTSHRLTTSYIGTRMAAEQKDPRFPARADGRIALGYLGYMRRDKGFFFFLDALERLPPALAKRLDVVIAASLFGPDSAERIKGLEKFVSRVVYHDGYDHTSLPGILATIDVGVVPVLWEDCLPQVAIEMVAAGIPILTADLGGASELLSRPELTFRSDDHADFASKLTAIVERPALLRSAFADKMVLRTTDQHYRELRRSHYL